MPKFVRVLLPLGRKKVELLDSYNWYRNMHGGWTDPHCMDFMTRSQIASKSLEELEFALQHGSRATYVPSTSKS